MIKKVKKSEIDEIKDKRPRWKKLQGGIHYHSDGQVVKKGETLRANPEEMSEVVQAMFRRLDPLPTEIEDDGGIRLAAKRRSNGWYDVINTRTGKQLNEKALREDEAKRFIVDMLVLPDESEEEEDEEEEEKE